MLGTGLLSALEGMTRRLTAARRATEKRGGIGVHGVFHVVSHSYLGLQHFGNDRMAGNDNLEDVPILDV